MSVPQSPSGAHLSRAAPELAPFFPISYLHPNGGKKSKYKTSVRKKTPNPEFNEVGQGWGEAVLAAGGGAGAGSTSRLREHRPQLP